ncbi:hypothetical protein LEM8419_01749 [Neolewinella maritima]|uniref:DUF4198 domain-containing protein n=1 Tax=Neolewinella maritima TaxID=1383882 RepID=A0ABM9B113_9BACT|nr:DUF4198 domain-containing protein [Neolewinella maritima]CAH1000615.1 hypothetical protein LEM8419_01749 [Neolewinella maritima]
MRPFLFVLVALVVLSSHDMYLRLDSYFLPPDSEATIQLYNGTFDRSDNTIDRSRMQDVSLVAGGTRTPVDSSQWREEGETTVLDFTTGAAGTYVAGVSTRARSIALAAADFNDYLEHDGVVDMLETRRRTGQLEQDAVELYSKHVKTIFQVGDRWTDDWSTPLHYPIEFIPLSNPYDLHAGDSLQVVLQFRDQPLSDQLVLIGNDHEHSHSHDGDTHAHAGAELRTDARGTLTIPIASDGTWHLRTILMTESEQEGLTHESNWATLTFAVDHGQPHSHAAGAEHDHAYGHEHEHTWGIPGYAYLLGSLALLGALFLYFNRRT